VANDLAWLAEIGLDEPRIRTIKTFLKKMWVKTSFKVPGCSA
jgi:hypothetical protein